MRITVPLVPPSPNELRRKYRHWADYGRLRKAWENTIWALTDAQQKISLPKPLNGEKVHVSFHIEHAQLFDPDNLTGSVKPCLDAMVRLNLIRDDSSDYIELSVTQEKSKERQTTIEITAAFWEAT